MSARYFDGYNLMSDDIYEHLMYGETASRRSRRLSPR